MTPPKPRLGGGVPRQSSACSSRPMTAPWIIDTWVNLLRPLPAGENPQGEEIFARYGMLDLLRQGTKPEALIAEMDAAQVVMGGLCGQDLQWVADICARYP